MKLIKDWLIPHSGNAHTPYVFRFAGVLVTVFMVGLLGAGAVLGKSFFSGEDSSLAAVLPSVLVDLANQDRADQSLKKLTVNPLLTKAAEKKATDMATKGYFAHVSPEGREPWFWLRLVGYKYRAAGENLAVHFDDSGAVNAAWMASPSHRANIINSEFTEIGIGTAVGIFEGRRTTFVAQFFGLPATSTSSSLKGGITNSSISLSQKINSGPGVSAVEGARTSKEIVPVQGELNGDLLVDEEVPLTQVINALEQGDQKVSVPHRVSLPRRFATDPLKLFSVVVSMIAVIVSLSLVMMAHHHVPRRRFAHIGSGFLVLLVVISTYVFIQTLFIQKGKTTEVAAVIFLPDGN